MDVQYIIEKFGSCIGRGEKMMAGASGAPEEPSAGVLKARIAEVVSAAVSPEATVWLAAIRKNKAAANHRLCFAGISWLPKG